ncbi:hypothetical protein ACZ90_71115 [Streptomyces albus subsp. albus]|nr:hypothetical protein ACZ90_71115 [Streptomyces albus subsp. albus]
MALEAVDAALDGVALAVVGRVEVWRPTAAGTELLTVTRLLGFVRDGAADPSAAQVSAFISPERRRRSTSATLRCGRPASR